ncbi:nucleotidyl transferase AbiEii/AbiGii toxin family protein [Nocardiopsis sp. NRRL B-16309]|uniref:nucleotidyl transferase AbiEii/AbiGii toxin family protein n=1 Tax=Nocardiopsis sp. NRRL B-16309 TaxID=1519494 RepID=UPI0006ADAAEE|nr:nucleotidyl transferase AbiEii/AbiGii toxin family protein [Nocardiopsis sp. NRRL B-16309]
MTSGYEAFQQIQRKARSVAAREGRPVPTAVYLTRHALKSFLGRLTRTEHKDDFVLKGGILLAVYAVRRPTKDVDAEAIRTTVTPEVITQVIRDVAEVQGQGTANTKASTTGI